MPGGIGESPATVKGQGEPFPPHQTRPKSQRSDGRAERAGNNDIASKWEADGKPEDARGQTNLEKGLD